MNMLFQKLSSFMVFRYEDFVIEISENAQMYEAWLLKCGFSEKKYMFGWLKHQKGKIYTIYDFIELVDKNIKDYVGMYNEEIEEDE